MPWEGSALLCWGVDGCHAHALDSPSYFNDAEASRVAALLDSLLRCDRVACEPRDVGVLCAFRAQTLRIRALLRARGLGAVTVGQIYDFQGTEKKCVIVSLTLTRRPSAAAETDAAALPVGLLGARRFNVAVTRAKALCVVVGHPRLLASEDYWRDFYESCKENDAFRGADPDGNENGGAAELVDLIAEKKLLAAGDYERMYPTGDDICRRELHACETAWRVILV
mmetsp:Transcript_13338/g.41138  ORF Transcript_13338/g.41138 Transcript_13338/m.41138 type:complete len:225 (+) Transcript_13338:467-1141(+)